MYVGIWGGNGFLGQYILNNSKHHCVNISREILHMTNEHQVELFLQKNYFDVIVNCAIKGNGDKDDYNIENVINNLTIHNILRRLSGHYGKLINIGSGAEFNKRSEIWEAKENEIFIRSPSDSYGISKNLIAKSVLTQTNAITLRLFGCFDKSEPDYRLFKKVLKQEEMIVYNCFFDYISAEDFVKIFDVVCDLPIHKIPKDMNLVYTDKNKSLLSDIIKRFCVIKDIPITHIKYASYPAISNSYTGDSTKLLEFIQRHDINLSGLDKSFINYSVQ